MSSLFDNKFTITLTNAIQEDATLLDGIAFTNSTYTTAFKNALIDRFAIYELCTDDLEEFKILINNRFRLNKEWFERTLEKYYQALDETQGYYYNKISTTENEYSDSKMGNTSSDISNTEAITSNLSFAETNNTDKTTTNIELPHTPTTTEYPNNKLVEDTDSNNYGTNNGSSSTNTIGNIDTDTALSNVGDSSESFSEIRTGGINVIDQRERILKYIKSKYYEFTEYFKSLFIMLYY